MLQDGADKNQPTGFGGSIRQARCWLPPGSRILSLPADGVPDGPGLKVPPGPHAAILLETIPESLGNLERLFRQLADALAEGGVLVVDAALMQSLRMLRTVVEGRPGSMEPTGSVHDPERPVALRRLLAAAMHAGLVVEDVASVPTFLQDSGASLCRALFHEGLLPLAFMARRPTSRVWLRCRRTARRSGSVLIGGGPRAAQEQTVAALAGFLPTDFEILTGDGPDERSTFHTLLPRSSGEVLWFLRAGAVPSAEVFQALLDRVLFSPVLPAATCAGDLSGLMATRLDVFELGPFDCSYQNDLVAYEEYGMRLETIRRSVTTVPGAFTTPSAGCASPARLAAESERLVDCYALLSDSPVRPEEAVGSRSSPGIVPWVDRAPRITLCMIAKNEERFLAECLQRAAPCVDEIILVDTGSTDRTVQIAESFGAQVLHEPWTDDFAAARNVGLAAATGDWILVLDADEQLEDDARSKIRAAVLRPDVAGYHLNFRNVYDGGHTIGVLMVRLFRNLAGARFFNRIHEQITPALIEKGAPAGLKLSILDLEVLHYGYQDAVMNDKRKNERNERLFRLQLEQHPDDIYSLYKYGDFLRRVPGRDADALRLLQQCLDLIEALPPSAVELIPYAGEVAALCALEHARQDHDAIAGQIVERALRRLIPTPNLHYIAASLALHGGRPDEAIQHYERCLAYRDQTLVVPIQEGVTSYVSLTGIAKAWMQKGDRARARRLLGLALSVQPDHDVAVLALSQLHCEEGDPGGALSVLSSYLAGHPEAAGVCQQATMILLRLGLVDQARAMGARAVKLLRDRCLVAEARRMEETLAAVG